MSIEFRLPELGENIEEAEVAEILVKEGDEIAAEQSVMELETEKAVVELPCPHAGRIEKIHVSDGDAIKVGTVLLTIDESGASGDGKAKESKAPEGEREEAEQKTPKAKKTAESEDEQVEAESQDVEQKEADKKEPEVIETKQNETQRKGPAKKPAEKKDKPKTMTTAAKREEQPADDEDETPPPPAGPATRHMARKLGVDLYQVAGTGSGGRITQEDVEAWVRDRLATGGAEPVGKRAATLPDFSKYGPVERQRESKLYRTAADQLSTSWGTIPHVTQHDLADVTDMEAARKRYLQSAGKDGPKITLTAVAVKACVTLLQEMPRFNSSLDAAAGELVLKQYYHIGVAVDTEHGLVVPVIRDADRKTILDVAAELIDLADKARARKLGPDQMQGANFTITNLGGIGGTAFSPIINFPEVAILGMSRARNELRLIDGELQERLMLPLSLSYDHRVINGADAARFIVRLSSLLSQPFGLLANS
jgi:pyruvate dehydrogenase E2 component (dihydrolipoamide acetyltransferase)